MNSEGSGNVENGNGHVDSEGDAWTTDQESIDSETNSVSEDEISIQESTQTDDLFSVEDDYEFFDVDQHLGLMSDNYNPKERFVQFRKDYLEFLKKKQQEYDIPVETLYRFNEDFEELKHGVDLEIIEFTNPENTEFLASVLMELDNLDILVFERDSILNRHVSILGEAVKSKNFHELTFSKFTPPTDNFFQLFSESKIQFARIDTDCLTKAQLLDFISIIPQITALEFLSYHAEFNDLVRIPSTVEKLYFEGVEDNEIGSIFAALGPLKVLSFKDASLLETDWKKLSTYLLNTDCGLFSFDSHSITAPLVFKDILKSIRCSHLELFFKELPYLPSLKYNMNIEQLAFSFNSTSEEHVAELIKTSRSLLHLNIYGLPHGNLDDVIKNSRLNTFKIDGRYVYHDKFVENASKRDQGLRDVFLASKTIQLLNFPNEIRNMIFHIIMLQGGVGARSLSRLSKNLFRGKQFEGEFNLETLLK
ncbi:hypothetical protein HK103_001789 [Boothiomyces macroporosus]|uniref:Uncharacterized protein n=1 Tax=Boothiomyces macroporosus TaxID=261099 RepID=A0AAD5Y2W5_9FUNG|nr:hypothetical protein HK103_001789 [Boothiomyces macroporosus]